MITRKESVRYQLEIQSTRIEGVLGSQGISAVVTGGKVFTEQFCFDLNLFSPVGGVSLADLEKALAESLQVAAVKVTCQENKMMVMVAPQSSLPLDLLGLMKSVGAVRPLTTILGMAEDGRPLMLNLETAEVTNILVVGQAGAGKSSLLRAFLFSLAANNKQHQFQAVVVDYDPAGRDGEVAEGPLAAFSHLPHLILPVASHFEQAVEALDFLVGESEYRLKQEIAYPRIVLVIDNLDLLLAAGDEALFRRLLFLLENGPEVGLHLALALENPTGPFTDTLFKCDISVRFVGQMKNDKMAWAAAGIPDTGAEYLAGQGDFIGINCGNQLRFRTAYLSDYNLYLAVARLAQQKRPRIVATPVVFRPNLVALGGG